MSPSRKPWPSFMLVLTSGHHSLLPTTLQFDSYESPAMLPTAPDSLMKTIDLRDDPKDALECACDEDADAQTIFEAESPATFDRGAEQTSNHSIKQNLLLFIRKFIPYKRNFVNNEPLVAALKTC
ncbi:hypothetical protein BYT27DRAFT_7194459, partial [Phlegmacium glaucopus]